VVQVWTNKSKRRKAVVNKGKSTIAKCETIPEKPGSRAIAIISSGDVKSGSKFAELMSALMSDLITGAMTPDVGNATCNAGGKVLKVVEMQHKYGIKGGDLPLIGPK
jgi:hypothetical protein